MIPAVLLVFIASFIKVYAWIEIGVHVDPTSPYNDDNGVKGIFYMDRPIRPHDFDQTREIRFQWITKPRVLATRKFENVAFDLYAFSVDGYNEIYRRHTNIKVIKENEIIFRIPTDPIINSCVHSGPHIYPFYIAIEDYVENELFYKSGLIYINTHGYDLIPRNENPTSDQIFRQVFAALSEKRLLEKLISENPEKKFLINQYVKLISNLEIDPQNAVRESLVCPICTEDITHEEFLDGKLKEIPCGHMFHKACIDLWTSRKMACPFRCVDT